MPRCPNCHRRLTPLARCPNDGARAPSRAPPPPIGAFEVPSVRLAELVAQGWFSSVFRGFGPGDTHVAVKVGRERDASSRARFVRETDALTRIGPPWAPRLHGSGVLVDGRPFLVTQWFDAPTLGAWLEALERPPDFEVVVRVGAALLSSLISVIERGVLHRDLKPENFLILAVESEPARPADTGKSATLGMSDGTRAVVLDFGTARFRGAGEAPLDAVSTDTTSVAGLVGTSEYLSPERVRGAGDDERSEVYAMGVVLYELATLRLPFPEGGRTGLHAHVALVPPVPSRFASLPAAFEQLLLDCIAKDPERRPASIAIVRERLLESLGARVPALSAPSTTAAVSTFTKGAQPAVILVVDSSSSIAALVEAVESCRGFVARFRGRRSVSVFPVADSDAPIDAAFDALEILERARQPLRAALHLSSITLRRSADGAPVAYGKTIEKPESWLPHEFDGVLLTPALAAAAGETKLLRLSSALSVSVREIDKEASGEPGSRPALAEPPPLLGREPVLAAIAASLREWRAAGSPARLLLIGRNASGKSRIAAEIERLARELADVRVLSLRARRTSGEKRTSFELFHALGGTPEWASRAPSVTLAGLLAAVRANAEARPLAIVLDDAHLADDLLLDALEIAFQPASRLRLWVLYLGSPLLLDRRKSWNNAVDFPKLEIGALGAAAARALVMHVLRPADYVPVEAVDHLCEWTGHLPGLIVELGLAIHRAGLVRSRPDTRSHYLELAELSRLPAGAIWSFLASRELEGLDPGVATVARLAAILGPTVLREELEWVQGGLARGSAEPRFVDTGVALEILIDAGILVAASGVEGAYAFQSPALAGALLGSCDPEDRLRVHQHAFQYWRARGSSSEKTLEALARHGAAVGAREHAFQAHRELADRARLEQRLVESEAHYTRALEFCDVEREESGILINRAKVRYRVYRLGEARSDLRRARELADRIQDPRLACLALFEVGTVLDWGGEYAELAQPTELGLALAAETPDALLRIQSYVASGRLAWRRGELETAIERLSQGAELAKTLAEARECRTIALLLLSCALVQAERTEEAEERFAEVIRLSSESKDYLHLCAALGNRAFLWAARGEAGRCIEDLERTVELARELGNPWTERNAIINLAEVLYWAGREDEAVPLLHRARLLEARFMERPVYEAVLLLARIDALKGNADAAGHVDWLMRHALPPPEAKNSVALCSALCHLLGAPTGRAEPPRVPALSWPQIAALSQEFLADERAELAYWRARAALSADPSAREELEVARAGVGDHGVWLRRLNLLAPTV